MKKTLVVLFGLVLVNLFIGCSAADFGSQQTDNRIYQATKQIEEKESIIISLEQKLSNGGANYDDKEKINNKISEIKKQINDLTQTKDRIISGYINSSDVPDELTILEKDRRLRANVLKRESMVIEKVKKNLSSLDVSEGYKVIFDNQYSEPITFSLKPKDGGEKTAVHLRPKEIQRIYLVPGSYVVSFLNGGAIIGRPVDMNIDGQKKFYRGEECFAFAYMPSR